MQYCIRAMLLPLSHAAFLFMLPHNTVYYVCMCNTHQELQQSVGPIDTVDNLIHVLYWSLTKLLHHEENIDQQSAEDLGVTEENVFNIFM